MLNIYVIENVDKQNDNLIHFLPKKIKNKIINYYKNPTLQKIKINTYSFLFFKLNELFKIKNDEFVYSIYKKPYLKNKKNIFFNISHFSNISSIAISNKEVGIDLMPYIKPNNLIIDYAFNLSEKNKVSISINKNVEFTKIWAKKEAWIKYHGGGINAHMNKIDTFKIPVKIKYFNLYLIAYMSYEKKSKLMKIHHF